MLICFIRGEPVKSAAYLVPPNPPYNHFMEERHRRVRLTATVRAGGCASKLRSAPAVLDAFCESLPKQSDANVLVGFDSCRRCGSLSNQQQHCTGPDRGFFHSHGGRSLHFGQIAATNALSDVYAMGGRPITAWHTFVFRPRAMC